MSFKSIACEEVKSDSLKSEYKSGRKYGVITLSGNHLFFRRGFRKFFISYEAVECAFRRVYVLTARVKREKREIPVERLVIMNKGAEVAEIGLPGINAAKEIMGILKDKCKNATFEAPKEVLKNE